MTFIRPQISITLSILTTFLALTMAGLAYASPPAAATIVIFDGDGFSPETITVTVGSQVVWQNNTGVDHRLQSRSASTVYLPLILKNQTGQTTGSASAQVRIGPAADGFGGPLPAGGDFSHTFTGPGTYDYFLTTAPQFTGRVVVVEGGPGGAAALHGVVRDTDGGRLAEALVTVPATGDSGLTTIDGEVTVNNVPTGRPVLLQVSKTGYADQWVRLTIPAALTQTIFETALRPRQAPFLVTNAEIGFTVNGAAGAGLELPANALVNQNGDPVTGSILVTMTPVDVNSSEIAGFPGGFEGVTGGGQPEPILSYGAVEFILTQDDQPLQLAPGQKATIHLPIFVGAHQDGTAIAPGQTIPLWSLNETDGLWEQEGTGRVVSSLQSPTALVAEAEINHLSWWNLDIPFDGPPFWIVPRCQIGGVDVACHIEATPVCAVSPAISVGGAVCVKKADAPPVRTAVADIPAGNTEALPVPAGQPIRVKATGVEGFDSAVDYVFGQENEVEVVILDLDSTGLEPFAPGKAIKAAIDPANEIDRYTFLGQPDEHVFVDVRPAAGSSLGGAVKLDDPANTTLFDETFSTLAPAYDTIPLTLSGTYTITVDGTANEPGSYLLALRRRLPFDPTFGTQGIAEGEAGTTPIGEMVLQSDGKFVTVQNSGTVFRVRRFESDGTADTGFGSNGLAELDSSLAQAAHDLALQADGKIVVAAQRNAGFNNGRENFVVVRLNPNGSLDTSFGASGTVELDSTDNDVLDQILVQPDGKIVAAGRADNTLTLIRLNANGVLDTTFDGDGIVTDSRMTFPEAGLVRQADGKLLVSGWTTAASGGANLDAGLLRFNSDGSLDTSFGTNGLVAADLGNDDYARAMALQSDGTILVAGENGIRSNPFVLAYTGGGALETDFGVNGKLTLEVSTETAIRDMAVAADDEFAVVGSGESFIPGNTDDDFLLAWYQADGVPVAGAGEAGVSLIPIGRAGFSDDNDRISAVVIQPDGKIVAGGSTRAGSATISVLARFGP